MMIVMARRSVVVIVADDRRRRWGIVIAVFDDGWWWRRRVNRSTDRLADHYTGHRADCERDEIVMTAVMVVMMTTACHGLRGGQRKSGEAQSQNEPTHFLSRADMLRA